LFLIFGSLLSCSTETVEEGLQIKQNMVAEEVRDWSQSGLIAGLSPEPDFGYLARISLDLRGRRPSPEELWRYSQSPQDLPDMVDDMLGDSNFPTQMTWYWNDAINSALWGAQYQQFGELDFETWKSLGWEPLSFIEKTIRDGLPFTHIVTAQQMPTNEIIGEIWEMPGTADWQWADPSDNRPMAGIISSRALWIRYQVDLSNRNRFRANTVSRIFLCADFLERG